MFIRVPLCSCLDLTEVGLQSRIQWMVSLGNELGGPAKSESMLKAKDVGFILKYIDCKYRRPVTYPDTVRTFLLLPCDVLFRA
jgi:hypothetical protein